MFGVTIIRIVSFLSPALNHAQQIYSGKFSFAYKPRKLDKSWRRITKTNGVVLE